MHDVLGFIWLYCGMVGVLNSIHTCASNSNKSHVLCIIFFFIILRKCSHLLTWKCRVKHLGLLYISSLLVLVGYSILYGLTSKEARWLGALTSVAVVILGNVFSSLHH